MASHYNHAAIEKKWRENWEKNPINVNDGKKEKYYCLDVDRLIASELMVNLPMKVLCREDCKGICRKCGKNLNEGACGCDDSVPDPRMSVIQDIFKQFKEV